MWTSDLGPLGHSICVQPPSDAQLQQELAALAVQGKWHAVLELTEKYGLQLPLQQQQQSAETHAGSLTCTTYKVLALMKLRRYNQAADELSELGDLDHEEYEQHLVNGEHISAIPFALRYLACELPARLNKPHVTLDLLYHLKAYCQDHCNPRNGNTSTSSAAGTNSRTGNRSKEANVMQGSAHWRRRHQAVSCALVAHHLQHHDLHAALQLLEQLLAESPHEPLLWSTLGRLQLQLGDTKHAAATFAWAEELLQGPGAMEGVLDGREQRLLLRHNAANWKFMAGDYTGAEKKFAAAIAEDPSDVVAANNRAICLLHTGQLQESVAQLQTGLAEHAAAFLQEPVLANLGTLCDVAFPASRQEARLQLTTWAIRLVPDDFDLVCLQH